MANVHRLHKLKQSYPTKAPLPRIGQVVDAGAGQEILCFLDADKGYYRIQMTVKDMKKNDFVTNNGIFCYTRMPSKLRTWE